MRLLLSILLLLLLPSISSAAVTSFMIPSNGSGNIGISTIATSTIQVTTNPADGYILTSDASGVGSWVAPPASSSNNWIVTSNIGVGTRDPVGIGTTKPTNALSVLSTMDVSDPITSGAATAEIQLQAGGAGGSGSGGGAGGRIYEAAHVITVQNYPVVVGDGGAGGVSVSVDGGDGGDTTFDSLTALGGGGGRPTGNGNGLPGGSGGGAPNGLGATLVGGTGTVGQGYDGGGCNAAYGAPNYPTAGGAGAGGNGQDCQSGTQAGNGGAGVSSSISGSATSYACGGAGGMYTGGTAGTDACGGGFGNIDGGTGGNGVDGTGSGGGGSGNGGTGGNGGKGSFIVSYPTGSITATGGTITTSGGNTIHTFTANGNFNVTSTSGGGTYFIAKNSSIGIGIGTATPATKLDVAGIVRSRTGGIQFPDDTIQTTAAVGGGTNWLQGQGIGTYGPVGIGTVDASGGSLIVVGGNVGIGSLSPGAELDVVGAIRATSVGVGTYVVCDQSGNCPSGGGGGSQWVDSGSDIYFSAGNVGIGTNQVSNSGLSVMNGNVGIGTWKAESTLSIIGDVEINNDTVSTYGKATATANRLDINHTMSY